MRPAPPKCWWCDRPADTVDKLGRPVCDGCLTDNLG